MVVEQPPRLLRLAQIASMLQVHPKTVYYWVRTGRLNALTSPGGLLRVRAEDARALCENAGLPVPADLAQVRRRVHVVEYDKERTRPVMRHLKSKGFEVRAFEDTYEALVATVKEPPELLIIDLETPDVDAMRMLQALRRDEATRRIKVVFCGELDADDTQAAREAGAEMVIPAHDANALTRLIK